MKKAAALLITLLIIILSFLAINSSKGKISEVYDKTYYFTEFTEWSDQGKHELSLGEHDELQVDIVCESGSIALDIRGKNGARAYRGNGLNTGIFTVTVPEAGEYVVVIKGENATGSFKLKKLSR